MIYLEGIKKLFVTYGQEWLAALIILIVGVLISKLSRRWLRAILNRSRIRDDLLLKNFFLRSVSLAIFLVAIIIALDRVHVPVNSLIAGLGVTGLILGFGLRDTLSNFAAGLLLLIYRPFRAGEIIEVEGAHGTVEELTIVNMQMTTSDGVRVIMPNSKVWGSKIVNYSLSKRRRLELTLKVPDTDVERAIETIKGALDADDRILKKPAPLVRVTSVEDNAATLSIWAWTDPEDFQDVSADEYIRLSARFGEAELQIV
ncbi:MAG TPA: mechanosensitive ion channel family protein [Blastocatellia bacterium]|nr:mechanosensitive ion channel family protein [Blastocatellia bacterium]